MNKQSKKFTKEWIELTLCDMLDEIFLIKNKADKDKMMEIIKKYSVEIYDTQKNDT